MIIWLPLEMAALKNNTDKDSLAHLSYSKYSKDGD